MNPIYVPFIVQAVCQIGVSAGLCIGSPQVQRTPSLPQLITSSIVNQYQYNYYPYMYNQ